MPTLTIRVEDLPEAFVGESIRLVLQTKTGYVESDNLSFDVAYDLRDGKPVGSAVQRQPDGRRFVYLAWLSGGTMVGRIKVQFDALTSEQLAQDTVVTLSARDA